MTGFQKLGSRSHSQYQRPISDCSTLTTKPAQDNERPAWVSNPWQCLGTHGTLGCFDPTGKHRQSLQGRLSRQEGQIYEVVKRPRLVLSLQVLVDLDQPEESMLTRFKLGDNTYLASGSTEWV